MSRLFLPFRCGLIALVVGLLPLAVSAANWSVARVNHAVIAPPAGVTISEMSGVTYVGPVAGAHRFIAAEETKGELLRFDLSFTAGGGIAAISNVTAIDIIPVHDFEGIAYTNSAQNSVFLASESGAHLREISLATGAELQTVAIPGVFDSRLGNNGLESLTRAGNGSVMWTANEEALTVDGSNSEGGGSTVVRLLNLNVAGNAVTPGPQFAYGVSPFHGGATILGARSGLADLVLMPDGSLLTLERSVASGFPLFLSRIFEVDFADATDVSIGPTATGLKNQSYTPVDKELLWSGSADNSGNGKNLEGLTLGPQLANGSWTLIGVTDNGDPFGNNSIIALTATQLPSADFNADGIVDGADFLQWQRGSGKTIGATHQEGDANRDGAVDAADLELWQASFSAPAAARTTTAIPEPATSVLGLAAVLVAAAHKKVRRSSRRT